MPVQSYLGIFADDTELYSPFCLPEDPSILQDDIDSVSQWCRTWLYFLNLPKCHHSTISHSSSNTQYFFSSENDGMLTRISTVTKEMDLGIGDLKFTSHVDQIVMKAI